MNKYIENVKKVKRTDDAPIYFDHYDAESLHEILDAQHNINEYTRPKNDKKLFSDIDNYL